MNAEQDALLTVAIMSALCDREQSDAERAAIARSTDGSSADIERIVREVESGQASLARVAAALSTPANKRLAFEVATAVCNSDGVSNAAETQFLQNLRSALGLGAESAKIEQNARDVAAAPIAVGAASAAPDAASLDKMIFDAAVLNGALELLPDSLANMAILPLQMRLVYRIGRAHNFDLGREHIRDFIATLGVGLTAQYLEGFARKLLGGLLGGIGRQAASSGMAFVSTYAIGHAARKYYAGGRKLEALQLKESYQSLLTEAKSLLARAQNEIQTRAASLKTGNIADLIRSP